MRMRRVSFAAPAAISTCALMVCSGWSGCTGSSDPSDDLPPDDPQPAIELVQPAQGVPFIRDQLDEAGKLVATGTLAARVEHADAARVEYAIEGGPILGEAAGPDFALEVSFDYDALITLEATAYDESDAPLATTEARFWVAMAEKSCTEWLELFDVEHEPAGPVEGVPDPMLAQLPIGGIEYRYYYDEELRDTLVADCKTLVAMAMTAPYLRERGVESVVDIGVYDYRCIGGGTPPGCPNGVSQHALARAIDLHSFHTEDGTEYNVEFDWVIDGEEEPTCGAATEGPKDAWLHQLICELQAKGLWSILLTPNFNEAHRNHFHIDLSDGQGGLRSLGGGGVDLGDHAH